MMRTFAAAASGLIAALVLAGCGSSPESTAQASRAGSVALPSSAAPASGDGTFSEQQYLDLVRKGTDFWDKAADDKVIDSSKLACDVMEESLTDDQFFENYLKLVKSSTNNGMTAREAGAYITYAAGQFCTEQLVRLQNLPGA